MNKTPYEKNTCFNTRINLSRSIIDKNYDRIPVIVQSKKSPYTIKKVISLREMRYGEFIRNILPKLIIDQTKSIVFFVRDSNQEKIIPMNRSMGEMYDMFKNNDGFMYISWIEESTFGNNE